MLTLSLIQIIYEDCYFFESIFIAIVLGGVDSF